MSQQQEGGGPGFFAQPPFLAEYEAQQCETQHMPLHVRHEGMCRILAQGTLCSPSGRPVSWVTLQSFV